MLGLSRVRPYSGRVIHARTHPGLNEPGCFACRVSTVKVNTSAAASDIVAREKVLSADMDAYKRLKREGLQPATLGGSAHVEKTAKRRVDVEHPNLKHVPDTHIQAAGDALRAAL